MNWLTLAILSMVFFTILNLIQRILAVNTKYPRALSFLFNICAIFFTLIYFFGAGVYKKITLPSSPWAWVFVFIALSLYGLFERGRYIAAKKLNASTLSIINTVSLVVAFTGSIFLYSETLTFINGTGAMMIFISLFLISYSKNEPIGKIKDIGFGILLFTLLGLAWMLDKKGATYFGADFYSMLVWVLPIVFVIFPGIRLKEIKYELRVASWKILVPALVNVIGYLLQLKALEVGNATQILPIVQASTLLTVIAGILFLGEREAIGKKIFAGTLALIGSYLLVGAV